MKTIATIFLISILNSTPQITPVLSDSSTVIVSSEVKKKKKKGKKVSEKGKKKKKGFFSKIFGSK